MEPEVRDWLLDGDPAIRWQVRRDLLDASAEETAAERALVRSEGWGPRLLALQDPEGTWAQGLYSPKWTSTTYTLLLLYRMGLPAPDPQAWLGCEVLYDGATYYDGGITLAKTIPGPEVCMTAMMVILASAFDYADPRVGEAVDWLLGHQLADGGWNCESIRHGATHGSFHTTISVLEALREREAGHGVNPARSGAVSRAHEFLLAHRLYKSHRTGEVAHVAFTRFSFPPRWHYDVLRGLDYFASIDAPPDERCEDAIALVRKKEKDGRWPLQNAHKGKVWFDMERAGQPSRWNTLRARRVLRWWEAD